MNNLAPLIEEANRVIAAAIKHFKLTVSPDSILVTVQTKGRKNAVGWFWEGRWNTGKTALNEINMSAEHLKSHNMGGLLLHELAHAENNALGIQDCSGRVHNKKFKVMAEQLGLEVKSRDKSFGFGYTDLAEGGKNFLKGITFKQELFDKARFTETGKGKAGTRLVKVQCPGCGYVIRTTQKWIDEGLPTCHCGEEMEVA